jgi:hypothetical protein
MYEDVKCPACGRIGNNMIEIEPVKGHPNIEIKWLICECGETIREVTEWV